jgi:hypothetical protein
VLLNAVMLGLSPEQAAARYDAIVDFAELREFQDLKLKNYSSGMQVRLAFAVMVHVDADLLLIDEVLAVGDAAFQQKCYDVLHQAKRDGRTILLVTHDMDQVQRFCDRAMLLERGTIVHVGDSREVARRYTELNFAPRDELGRPLALVEAGPGDGRATVVDAWAQDGEGVRADTLEQGRSCALCVRVRFEADTVDPVFAVALTDPDGQVVFGASTEWEEHASGAFSPGEVVDIAVSFDNWFAPGRYDVSGRVLHPGTGRRVMAEQADATSFVVTGSRSGGGVVDVPHAFYLIRAGAAAEQIS